jgi:hypothetical protein
MSFCVDVCAQSEKCVDEVEMALNRHIVESGHASLRWGGGGGSRDEVGFER